MEACIRNEKRHAWSRVQAFLIAITGQPCISKFTNIPLTLNIPGNFTNRHLPYPLYINNPREFQLSSDPLPAPKRTHIIYIHKKLKTENKIIINHTFLVPNANAATELMTYIIWPPYLTMSLHCSMSPRNMTEWGSSHNGRVCSTSLYAPFYNHNSSNTSSCSLVCTKLYILTHTLPSYWAVS